MRTPGRSPFWRHPLAAPMGVGLGLRVAAALTGYGWFAPDDYAYVIEQGGRWLADPSAPFLCDYRSLLLPRLFFGLLWLARECGLQDPAYALRAAYLGLGLWSLLTIPAAYYLARRHGGEGAARTAAWLMAAYAIVPRIATRALLESVAMVPLIWSALCLDLARQGPARQRAGHGFLGGLLLGVAALFRFQVGVVFPAALALLLWPTARQARGRGAAVGGLLLGGLVAATVEMGIDALSDRAPLSTVWRYLDFNLHHAAQFGVSPWYTYILQFALFTVPPVTLLLWRPLWAVAKKQITVSALLALFVAVHSLVGHKEDRFMFPVLPLFLVLLAGALHALAHGDRWARRGAALFWAVNTVALMIATVSDAQRNLTVPLLDIARASHRAGATPATLAAVGVDTLPRYYLDSTTAVLRFDSVDALMTAVQGGSARPDYILLRHPPDAATGATLATLGCSAPTIYAGDLVDQALVALNPRNKRRSPTAMLRCPPAAVGLSSLSASETQP